MGEEAVGMRWKRSDHVRRKSEKKWADEETGGATRTLTVMFARARVVGVTKYGIYIHSSLYSSMPYLRHDAVNVIEHAQHHIFLRQGCRQVVVVGVRAAAM